MKTCLSLLLNLVFVLNSHADYLIYKKADGRVVSKSSSSACIEEYDFVEYNGEWKNEYFDSKKFINGVLTDKEEYGRKIVVAGDTELTAAINATTTLTIRLQDRNGNTLTGLDRDLKITTTRGKLGKIKAKSVNGELTVTFRGVDETVECIITVSDPAGEFISAVHKINLIP